MSVGHIRGLNDRERAVLEAMDEVPSNWMSVSRISDFCEYNSKQISNTMKVLEDAGFVEKWRDNSCASTWAMTELAAEMVGGDDA
jgi:DNA-binding MarR family transcriptional regulator